MSPKKIKNNKPEEVSSDIAYQELYQEMRRYRDYELSVSNWYTTILLAILGGILTAKYGGNLGLEKLAREGLFKFVAVFIVLLIGISGMWSVYFSHRRHEHLSDYIFDKNLNLEPDWKKNYKPENIWLKPHCLILVTQLVLTLATIAIVCLFN